MHPPPSWNWARRSEMEIADQQGKLTRDRRLTRCTKVKTSDGFLFL